MLSGIAAVVGLAVANAGIRWGIETFTHAASDGQPLPFWFSQPLPPLSIAYGCGLALLPAVVTGVLPAFKVTRIAIAPARDDGRRGRPEVRRRVDGLDRRQVALTVTLPVVTFFVKRGRRE